MNKNKLIICIVLVILLNNIQIIITNTPINFISFWQNTFSPLFLSMIISTLLIELNIPYYISLFIKNYSIRLFILSALLGFPNNILLIKNDIKNNLINEENINKLICYTTMNNPIYLITILKRIIPKYFIFVLGIYYLINLIICILFISNNKIIIKKTQTSSISNIISKNIPSIFSSLLNICSIIIFFQMLSSIINTNNYISCILKGIIEFTSGLNSLIIINISPIKKGIISLMILLFNSLSIHIQIQYLLSEYNINYKNYYISRLIIIFIFMVLICQTK